MRGMNSESVDLVKWRLERETVIYKESFIYDKVIHRADLPRRTDIGKLPPYRTHKDTLCGKQRGFRGGCGQHFMSRNLTIDHIVPKSIGGTGHIENLWLLCGACNLSKGTNSQVEFLKDRMSKHWGIPEWLLASRTGERLIEAQ